MRRQLKPRDNNKGDTDDNNVRADGEVRRQLKPRDNNKGDTDDNDVRADGEVWRQLKPRDNNKGDTDDNDVRADGEVQRQLKHSAGVSEVVNIAGAARDKNNIATTVAAAAVKIHDGKYKNK